MTAMVHISRALASPKASELGYWYPAKIKTTTVEGGSAAHREVGVFALMSVSRVSCPPSHFRLLASSSIRVSSPGASGYYCCHISFLAVAQRYRRLAFMRTAVEEVGNITTQVRRVSLRNILRWTWQTQLCRDVINFCKMLYKGTLLGALYPAGLT